MDFYIFNNNDKVKLNISAGSNWSDLNIQNQSLNSIFNKIDDGDNIVSENELSILEKILKKADTSKNNIIENEEFEKIIEQIDKGEIKLPKNNIQKSYENYTGSGYVEIQHNKKSLSELRENPEKFHKEELEKVRADLERRYPPETYELDIFYNGKGYEYEVYCQDCEKPAVKTYSQGITVIREDGIELNFKDYFKDSIEERQDGDYSDIKQSADFGEFTVTDQNGVEHKMNFYIESCYDRDIFDCRNVIKAASEFLGGLPAETINELIEKGVTDITFTNELDDPLLADKDYYRNKADENGNVVDIHEDFATIISPSFTPPERKYQDISFTGQNGYEFDIQNTAETSSVINAATPSGEKFKIEIRGQENVLMHQWQLPKLKRVLSELPDDVLRDLSKEINGIQFINGADANGQYIIGTNNIAYNIDPNAETPNISFTHELGHAIDEQNGKLFSEEPYFAEKFQKFKDLTDKFGIKEYALSQPAEFFASEYANIYYPNDKSSANHIAQIEEQMQGFETSEEPEKRQCYELFKELQADVKNRVNEVRTQSIEQRANNKIANIVHNEFQDILKETEQYQHFLNRYFSGQNIELDIIATLSSDEENYSSRLQFYEKFCNSKFSVLSGDIDLPEDLQNTFKKLVQKIEETRKNL